MSESKQDSSKLSRLQIWFWYNIGLLTASVVVPVGYVLALVAIPEDNRWLGLAAVNIGPPLVIIASMVWYGLSIFGLRKVKKWNKIVPILAIIVNTIVIAFFAFLYIYYLTGGWGQD